MSPHVWRDESGQARPVRRGSRCGREAQIFRLRLDDVRRNGWSPFPPAAFVNWCGHAQEFVPIPAGGRHVPTRADNWGGIVTLLLPDVAAFGLLAIAHDLLAPTLAVLVGLVIYVVVTTRTRIQWKESPIGRRGDGREATKGGQLLMSVRRLKVDALWGYEEGGSA